MPSKNLEKIKNEYLGEKYILDVPRYEVLANPSYCQRFEYNDTYLSEQIVEHSQYSIYSPFENLFRS